MIGGEQKAEMIENDEYYEIDDDAYAKKGRRKGSGDSDEPVCV